MSKIKSSGEIYCSTNPVRPSLWTQPCEV